MRSYETIPGWFDFHALYDEQVRRARSGTVLVEVGYWLGRSLAYLGQAVRASAKALDVYGVEHGRGSEEHRDQVAAAGGTVVGAPARNLLECGVSDVVSLIVAPSCRAVRLFTPGSVDFAFIDAGHDYQSVLSDLAAWWPRIRPGGALAGHDYSSEWPGVVKAVYSFFGRAGLHVSRCQLW
jgi:predicted O-methyltransferase YrrM